MSELDRIPDWMSPDITGKLDLKTWAQDFSDVYKVAEALCKTPFVPREMLGNQAMTTACIMKGRELGLDPFDALGAFYVVHGRVGVYADFMRRRILQAGHTLRILENTDSRCVIEGTRKEGGEPHRASFTAEQARKAGIDLGKYPADKLVARATSRLCKQAFPDVLSGTLIAEDLIDGLIPATDDTDTGAAPAAASKAPPLARRRATKAAKAAATQPAAAPKPDESDDIAELLGDDEPAESVEPAEPVEQTVPPIEAEEAEDYEPQPITAAQLTKLSILLREAGFDDREARHDFVAAAIGRAIDTAKDLTLSEASRVIDILENDSDTTDDDGER